MCASSFAMVLKDKNLAHAFILLQISSARHVRADNLQDLSRFQLMQAAIMPGSLHYDLVPPMPFIRSWNLPPERADVRTDAARRWDSFPSRTAAGAFSFLG